MTPEQFLKKWVEPAARGLKVLPEKLAMKDDLEAVIRAENQALQNVIDRQAEDLRCFENQGHNWSEEMIRKSDDWSPFVSREKGAELRNPNIKGFPPVNAKTFHAHGIVPPFDPELSRSYPIYKPDSQEVFDIEPRFAPDKSDVNKPTIKELIERKYLVPFNWGPSRETCEVMGKSDFAPKYFEPESPDKEQEIPEVLLQDDHIEDSPFCFPNFIKYGNDFGIKRPEVIEFRFAPDKPTGSTHEALTEEEYQQVLENRERKARLDRVREFDEDFK